MQNEEAVTSTQAGTEARAMVKDILEKAIGKGIIYTVHQGVMFRPSSVPCPVI